MHFNKKIVFMLKDFELKSRVVFSKMLQLLTFSVWYLQLLQMQPYFAPFPSFSFYTML